MPFSGKRVLLAFSFFFFYSKLNVVIILNASVCSSKQKWKPKKNSFKRVLLILLLTKNIFCPKFHSKHCHGDIAWEGDGSCRSVSMDHSEGLVPEGHRGSRNCRDVTENDVLLCFLLFGFTFKLSHTGQGMGECVEMWQLRQLQSRSKVQKRTKEWVFCNLPLQSFYSQSPSRFVRHSKVLLLMGRLIHLNGSRYFQCGYHCLHKQGGKTMAFSAYLHRPLCCQDV